MSNQILVPSLGESITEATVSKWLKQVGEEVDSDEPLVELETDKVNVEVPSPLAGILLSIKAKEGDTVEVGTLLGIVKNGNSKQNEKFESNIKLEDEPKIKKKNKEKNIKKENLIDEFEGEEKEVMQILIDHREEIKAPLKNVRTARMLLKKLKHYASEWDITFDDALDFWLATGACVCRTR